MRNSKKEQPSIRLLIIDILCTVISFMIAAFIRFGVVSRELFQGSYSTFFIILILVEIGIFYMHDTYTGFFRRGFLTEAKVVVKQTMLITVILTTILYLTDFATVQDKLFYIEIFFVFTLFDYLVRQYYKIIMLTFYRKSSLSNKVMIITTNGKAVKVIERLRNANLSEQLITSIAIIDQNVVGDIIDGIPVKANLHNLIDVIKNEVIDEVFINLPAESDCQLEDLIEELEIMGIKVQLNIDIFGIHFRERTIQSFGNYHVITFNKKEFKTSLLIMKRMIDIFGALLGLIVTAFITIFVAPAIYIESPGPVFFSQIRVGKNGRRFRIYKFRSMYPDAEERKIELLDQNEINGYMFKITDDPRITRVGSFLRKTSLDEFPQFFNVLKGDMSLVGTRPPTEDEFIQYEGRHKRRLSLKPGVTGLWQISGRSDITDFEEVVRLDLEYIDCWSLKLDFKVMIRTFGVLVFGKGAK